MSIEHDLAAALARRRPPEGFAERVLARAVEDRRRRRNRRRAVSALAAGLAALALALPPAFHLVEQRQAARRHAAAAEQARDELLLALAITSEKLDTATRTLRGDAPTAPPADRGDFR